MRKLFKSIIRTGIYPDTPEHLIDEITTINSIKFQGAIMVFLVGLGTLIAMPHHAVLIVPLVLSHLSVSIAVNRCNHARQYRLAKWMFILDPAALTLIVVAYFGIYANFHFIPIICFLVFLVVFRRRSADNLMALSTFLFISLLGIIMLYTFKVQMVELSEEEIASLRLFVYLLSSGLAIMMGVVTSQSSRKRTMKTEMSLELSQKEATILQTISDNMDEAIFKSYVNEGFVYVNHAFATMFGYGSKEEMLEVEPVNLYLSKAQREALLLEVEQKGRIRNKLIQYRRRDGSFFWGRLSTSRVEENGEVALVGTISDVTLQQEQTALLEENARQLRDSQRLAKVGSWRMFPDKLRIEWHGECARIHEFLPSEFEHPMQEWAHRLEDVDLELLSQEIKHASGIMKAYEFGSWYRLPSGDRKYLYYYCEQLHDDQGRRIWQGTVQDRTQLRQKEMEIDSTRAFYQDILESIPVEVVLLDGQLRYYYLSENAVRNDELRKWLIGKTNLDYAKHRNLDASFAEERDARCKEALETMLTVRWEEKMLTRDGRETYHLRNVVPVMLQMNGKEEPFLIGYSFDINDIKKAQFRLEDRNAELNQLNRELDRFVYSISHDLRAPIASVLGLNALAEETEDKEELDSVLMMQREALDRLDRYIRDVIDYSRNKRLDVTSDEVKLRAIVDECLNGLAYMSNYDQIEFFIEIDDAFEMITDQLRMKIIINNLLSNAIKYADAEKKKPFVSLRAERTKEGVNLEIKDNGIGIKKEYIDQIWEIFFRGISTISGSGLGLYILKESVKNLNGTVGVESMENEGTTFTLFFPDLDPKAP